MIGVEEQQVPEGFKKTEIGVLPEDWEVSTILEKMKLFNGYGFKPSQWSSHGLPIIRIQNLNDENAEFNYFEGSIDAKFHVKKGDLLFAWSGSKGSSFGARIWMRQDAVLNQHIFRVVPNKESLTDKYAYFVLRNVQEEIEKMAHGFKSSFVHVKKSDLNTTLLPVPPKKEQTAIANALSDVDTLITSLEKLINKKRAIKTAAMQQLLTGKKRLPPFDKTHTGYKQTELGEIPVDWEVAELGSFATFIGSGKTDTRNFGEFPLYGSTGKIGTCNAPEYTGESILVARVGANAGRLNYVTGSYGVTDNTIIIKLGNVSNIDYIKYQLVKRNLNSLVFGSGQPLITGSQLKAILLPVPKIEEQTAIAKVLFDMDQEIEGMSVRLNKTKQLKQGMMQELLTGRVRLV